jgi:drug/metabolite transporter (DMT)-like permease
MDERRLRRAEHRAGWLGYAMVTAAAVLFAVHGTVSKVILTTGLSSLRLAEMRTTGALVGLALVVAVARPKSMRLTRAEIPRLVLFGVGGVAFVQWFYFIAIHRIAIGIALLIQYLAPLLVALWSRFVLHRPVRRRLWVALGLAVTGLTLVVEIWSGGSLSGVGVAAAFAAAGTYALYILVADSAMTDRDAVSLTLYGFLFGALFWAIVQPWWSFPAGIMDDRVSLLGNLSSTHAPVWLLTTSLVVLGTIVPFTLMVGSLRHITATRVGITAMLEPVVATVVAFAWLDESLNAVQIAGGCVVLAGIVLAQTAR